MPHDVDGGFTVRLQPVVQVFQITGVKEYVIGIFHSGKADNNPLDRLFIANQMN